MLHFIVNPLARTGKGLALWKVIAPVLESRGVEYEVHMTKYGGHATVLAKELTESGEEIDLVVLGGDGSINEVINGICYPEKCTLGYIPTGSGNDFGRTFGLPTKPLEALEVVLARKSVRSINLGVSEYDGVKRRFVVSSGLGFDAGVCHGVQTSKVKNFLNHLKLGKLVYLVVALKQILFQPRVTATIRLDDKEPLTFNRTLFIAGMNLPYEGGGYKFCPYAVCDDDILDIICVSNVTTAQFLFMMPTAFSGKHVKYTKQVHLCQCRDAYITVESPLPVHTDGEPIPPVKSVHFSLEPEKLRIIEG